MVAWSTSFTGPFTGAITGAAGASEATSTEVRAPGLADTDNGVLGRRLVVQFPGGPHRPPSSTRTWLLRRRGWADGMVLKCSYPPSET